MSDEKKIPTNEDIFLAELEASRTGEKNDLSVFEESMNSLKSQALDDLEHISGLFSEARPDAGEIPEPVDNSILGHIKEKSREIKREQKVVRIFPRYKWAATAVMGVLVCVISYNLVFKMNKPENHSFEYDIAPRLTELSKEADKKIKPAARNELAVKTRQVSVDSMQRKPELKRVIVKSPVSIASDEEQKTIPARSAKDIDGNGRINIIDAYLMDRRLMSGVAMPEKMDLNGDGNIDREDINTIVKTVVSLGKGEV